VSLLLVGGRCPGCGLDLDGISPPDAVVTVRSLPRRWRGAFAKAGDEDDTEALLRRRPPDGRPSAVELACRVAEALALLGGHVRRTAVSEQPDLSPADVAPDRVAACAERSPEAALDQLAGAADALAAALDAVPSGAWLRPATLDGRLTDVRGLARAAAHEGTHHLREVERTLQEVRGRPD
jgi:DinB family protein